MIFRDSGFQRLIGGDDLLNPAHSASGGGHTAGDETGVITLSVGMLELLWRVAAAGR